MDEFTLIYGILLLKNEKFGKEMKTEAVHIHAMCIYVMAEMKVTMNSYVGFAQVYDALMDDIPYDIWSEYLVSLLREYGVEEGLLAELGCGTGSMTVRLHEAGYDMIGIDNSEEMLLVAREKSDGSILYLNQNMEEMELFGTVRAFVSVCDSINYLTDKSMLRETFRKVNNYLDSGGVFIFDLKTRHFYRDILGNGVLAESRDEVSYIWDNIYDEESSINNYLLTLFIKNDLGEQCFTRFEEEHIQRAYSLGEIEECLEEAGMEFVTAFDAFTREPARADSERIYVVARETFQQGKTYIK